MFSVTSCVKTYNMQINSVSKSFDWDSIIKSNRCLPSCFMSWLRKNVKWLLLLSKGDGLNAEFQNFKCCNLFTIRYRWFPPCRNAIVSFFLSQLSFYPFTSTTLGHEPLLSAHTAATDTYANNTTILHPHPSANTIPWTLGPDLFFVF